MVKLADNANLFFARPCPGGNASTRSANTSTAPRNLEHRPKCIDRQPDVSVRPLIFIIDLRRLRTIFRPCDLARKPIPARRGWPTHAKRASAPKDIAQFMPRTAIERGLLDPFDLIHALPKSAEFLSELHAEFGNLGLAAAAYNAGPQRLRDCLGGRGGISNETRSYVVAITGASVDDWTAARGTDREPATNPGCHELAALLTRPPNPFIGEMEQRVALGAMGVQLSAGFSRVLALRAYARGLRSSTRLYCRDMTRAFLQLGFRVVEPGHSISSRVGAILALLRRRCVPIFGALAALAWYYN